MNVAYQVKWLIFITLLINAAAMLSPVINGGDAIIYAALAQHISLHNDWVNLVLDGQDWLDKPHLPFWITALSFKIGGISAFTYILPGFLFHLIGGYFTFRIARLFYGRDSAWLSLLVYVSAYHLMDSSIEVKAEAYLTGCIMAACYYWLRYDTASKLKYLLLGALFSAMAVMTKGVFTLITIASGLVCLRLYQRQWHKLWSRKWLFAYALSLLFIVPEFVALYLQFDAHPEKVVFGQTQVSGILFFLWHSQFGRYFNTGPIQNHNGYPLFYVLVFLWAFLPWVAVFIAAMHSGIRKFSFLGAGERSSFIFLCGAFCVSFLLFSGTSFQIDYYMAILLPFAAILCGKYLADWLAMLGDGRKLFIAQLCITALLLVLAISLSIYVANAVVLTVVLAMSGALLGYGYVMRRHMRASVVLTFPVLGINIMYAFLVLTTALTFTSYSVAYNAKEQLADKTDAPIYVYQMNGVARELGLYSRSPCYAVVDPTQLPTKGARYYLLVREEQLAQLSERLGRVEQLAQGWWVVHKTGTFPRLLRLAKGTEPLEDIRIVQVEGGK